MNFLSARPEFGILGNGYFEITTFGMLLRSFCAWVTGADTAIWGCRLAQIRTGVRLG